MGGIVIIPEQGRFLSGGPLKRPISKGFHHGSATLESEYAEMEKKTAERKNEKGRTNE